MAERNSIPYEARRASKLRTWRSDVSADWQRFTANFTRENVISNLKTLAWVVPLTLLIWIYAEREHVATRKDVAVPFELATIDPNLVVALTPRQDKNLILELQGPQARLQEVLQTLRGGMMPQGLRIDIPLNLTPNREHEIPTLSLVQNQKIFTDNGVLVLGVQPSRLEVMIDQVVEREARVVKPPS